MRVSWRRPGISARERRKYSCGWTLPLSMPGVVSGITMTFLPAMTNYVILDMMYNSTYIMGSLIGSYFNIYDWNNGSMISLICSA